MLSFTLLLAFDPFTAFDVPEIAMWVPVAAGYVLSALYAVRAWRRKRWAALLVNLSVLAMLVVALLGLLE